MVVTTSYTLRNSTC